MRWIRSKSFAVIAATLTAAALFGGTLGMAFAVPRQVPLYQGMNLVGHVSSTPIAPAAFAACLPADAWSGIYLWDNRPADQGGQRWTHYFSGVPAYVNAEAANGITTIPAFAGVVVLATRDVPNAVFKGNANDSCP